MTTIDISLSAELVPSTERAPRRSKNSRNALRGTYVADQFFRIFFSGYSVATNSITTQSGLLQNTATNTKFINILFFFSTQPGFILSIIVFFLICLNYSTTELSIYMTEKKKNNSILQVTINNTKEDNTEQF